MSTLQRVCGLPREKGRHALLGMADPLPPLQQLSVEQMTVERRSRSRAGASKTGTPVRNGSEMMIEAAATEHGLDAMFALALPPALTDVVVRAVARVLPPRLARALGAAESPTRSGGRARGHEGGRGAS